LNRGKLLAAAYFVDQIFGDPEWFPHPVRLMGLVIERGEAVLRAPGQSDAVEFACGAALSIVVAGSAYGLTAALIGSVHRRSRPLGDAAEILLGWTCLAARDLEQEATAVTGALQRGDLPLARQRLARIVGRDTAGLDAQEISRAVIETVAESASDGIMAPLFYMGAGGVPLAMAYKAINTLDSTIGHADRRYFYFGKAAARLDDVANYLPSRLSALTIVATAALLRHQRTNTKTLDARTAWQIWLRDGGKHKSPNAGQPESAMAGALQVCLGGDNIYAGERIPGQRMGAEFPPADARAAVQAIRLVPTASLLGLCLSALATVLVPCFIRKRRRA
jgi:adenosylcobinamide-phosphate synthase